MSAKRPTAQTPATIRNPVARHACQRGGSRGKSRKAQRRADKVRQAKQPLEDRS